MLARPRPLAELKLECSGLCRDGACHTRPGYISISQRSKIQPATPWVVTLKIPSSGSLLNTSTLQPRAKSTDQKQAAAERAARNACPELSRRQRVVGRLLESWAVGKLVQSCPRLSRAPASHATITGVSADLRGDNLRHSRLQAAQNLLSRNADANAASLSSCDLGRQHTT